MTPKKINGNNSYFRLLLNRLNMNFRALLYIFVLIIFSSSCSSDDTENGNTTTELGITISQNGRNLPITIIDGKQHISMNNAGFSIRVANGASYEAIKISASNNLSSYFYENSYSSSFQPGNGMAASPGENGWPLVVAGETDFNSYGSSRSSIEGNDRIVDISNISNPIESQNIIILIYLDEEDNFSTDVVDSSNAEVIVLNFN